jgi:hypothetical protein
MTENIELQLLISICAMNMITLIVVIFRLIYWYLNKD